MGKWSGESESGSENAARQMGKKTASTTKCLTITATKGTANTTTTTTSTVTPTTGVVIMPMNLRTQGFLIEKADDNTGVVKGRFGFLGSEQQYEQTVKVARKEQTKNSEIYLYSDSQEPTSPKSEETKPRDSIGIGKAKTAIARFRRRLRKVARYMWIGCCPPWPPWILWRAAFAPPPRSYRFIDGDKCVHAKDWVRSSPEHPFQVDYRDTKRKQHRRNKVKEADPCLYELEGFFTKTKRGSVIAGVYLPAHKPTCTILYSHGNAMDIGKCLSFIYRLRRKLSAAVLVYDYTGFGLSSGRASEAHLYSDIEAAYSWLLSRNTPPSTIVLYGFSLGTAASAHLAASEPAIAGLVLAGAFVSGLNIFPAFKCLVDLDRPKPSLDVLKTYAVVPNISQKVLVVHGVADELIDIAHPLWLIDHLPKTAKPLFILEANHNDLETKPQLFFRFAEYISKDLGFKVPHLATRTKFIHLLRNRIPLLHYTCTDKVFEVGAVCYDCRHHIALHFCDLDQSRNLGIAPQITSNPAELFIQVDPLSVGGLWSGRYSITLTWFPLSYDDVRNDRIPAVPHVPTPTSRLSE